MTLRRNEVICGDARESLAQVSDGAIDMVLTSPPYFRLRDYRVAGQIGLEAHVERWVSELRAVAAEVKRTLVPSGSFWLNLADTYSSRPSQGAAPKSLLLAPERLALSLLADGWLLRNKIVWHKVNSITTSVGDRFGHVWEAVYVFVKQPRYFFDLDAVRTAHTTQGRARAEDSSRPSAAPPREVWRGPNSVTSDAGLAAMHARGFVGHPLGKNPGDVWSLQTSSYRSLHHATFPLSLATRAVAAGCAEARCRDCRAPWRRQTIRAVGGSARRGALGPSCDCAAPSESGLVLDPFFGAGTTGLAAEALQRDWLGVELNPSFADHAAARIEMARAAREQRR